MDRHQATALVREVFTQRFDEARFLHFLRNLVNHLDESTRQPFSGNYIKRAFAEQVGHYVRLGTYTDPRGERVDCLAIYLRRETTLARGRVTLRNFVADYLSTGHGRGKAAVIAAFVSPKEDDWRFSFVKLDFTLETTELGFVTERAQLTPARRYSYLVGKHENCHTAQKQFLELLETDQADPTVSILEASFSVEKVTKEFFEHYRTLFESTRDAFAAFLASQPRTAQDFEDRGISEDDFAKKLLGQIVFLYFLQKKGWFGVDRGKAWGSGRKDFIRHTFEHREEYSGLQGRRQAGSNFFNDILEPLFYEALASPRLDDDHYYSRFDCRIPFLNGGLFEPLYGYNWVETDVLLPDTLFSNSDPAEAGDVGTGILDVFDRYNFTVNEAEPLEKEVAVDPEMLGKVFENLLPENMRHRSGTYYTPRVVVHYMCQQALLNYLATNAPELSQDQLAVFLHFAERFADFEAIKTENHSDKRLPDVIVQSSAKLDDLLANVSVCDPAIGSGAFPVAMMHEIVRARMALTAALENSPDDRTGRSAYSLKRHAIQQSLYGVDDDPGAVEIAKLRLWLSMVVDEEELRDIQPLPNLDYKIMQGNSLSDEFDGVRLLDEDVLQRDNWSDPASRLAEIDRQLKAIEERLGSLQSTGRLNRDAVASLKNAAGALMKQRKAVLDRTTVESRQDQLTLGSRSSLKRIQQLHAEFFDEPSRIRKDALRAEMEALEWEFMRATLREQGREQALADLERASSKHRRPYFLWKLHFAEIFQAKQGFDIVIANPPFVRMEFIKDQKPSLKRRFPHLFSGRSDLYVFFFGIGLEILRDKGCLAFISSNTYLNAQFGTALRKYLVETTSIGTLIDFAEAHVFDAIVEPAIIILRKSPNASSTIRFMKWQQELQSIEELPEASASRSRSVSQDVLNGESWRLIGGVEAQLLETLNRGKPLKLMAPDGILYGVKTGLNDAFVIPEDVYVDLCRDRRSREILKPFIQGRDISRWAIKPSNFWLIYTYHGIDISKYPRVKAYLGKHKAALQARATRQEWYELQQPQFRYSSLFSKPKIVYQDISRSYAFSYDTAGCFCGNTTFILPTPSVAILGILQSNVMRWWVHTDQGVPFGGFLRLQTQYMERCPIPPMTPRQEGMLSNLVQYLIWTTAKVLSEPGDFPRSRLALVAAYLEQWVNALVYELFFGDTLLTSGLNFFDITADLKLPPISEIKGSEHEEIQLLFDEVYSGDHRLRQSLFSLDSVETIRIIEGKA